MIFRFNSKDGRFRTEDFNPEQLDFPSLVQQQIVSKLPPGVVVDSIKISQSANETGTRVQEWLGKAISEFNFKNGEMFFLHYDVNDTPVESAASAPLAGGVTSVPIKTPEQTRQLPVDDELDKEQGLIPRTRSALCKHGDKGMCEYCSPLPPYDVSYHEEKNIKHISYHAYVRSLNDQLNRKDSPTSFIPPLEEPVFTKTPNCPNHPPQQICSKCQPSAITLQQQRFRMVDHVEISNPEMVNEFINTWRKSGLQRIGVMVGRYEKYDEVPLGIKARVEAIYELPQRDEIDGLELDADSFEDELDKVTKLSSAFGLQPVGFMFTDLTDSGLGNQTVLCKRHKDSFFLSSLEVIFAARQQLANPNKSKWSASGKFSSKFITCCITGNDKGEIDIFAYQVSNGAEKLVEADLIAPSTHPSCVFIKEEDKDRYVPEIFYNKINEYGRQVKQNAKPWFPVEYLIVSLTHGFPKPKSDEKILFPKISNFPIENRNYLHELQSIQEVGKALGINAQTGEYDLNSLPSNFASNFHLLYYILFNLDILNAEAKDQILDIVKKLESRVIDHAELYKLLENESWNTLIAILMAH